MKLNCEVCGTETSTGAGACTNGRCPTCHQAHCTPGGDTSPGHGRLWPERVLQPAAVHQRGYDDGKYGQRVDTVFRDKLSRTQREAYDRSNRLGRAFAVRC